MNRTNAADVDITDLEEVPHEVSESPTVTFSVRLDRPTVERLRQIAEAEGVGPTVLVRKWVMEHLTQNERPSYEAQRELLEQTMQRAYELINDAVTRAEKIGA
jgi:hypothetical protein